MDALLVVSGVGVAGVLGGAVGWFFGWLEARQEVQRLEMALRSAELSSGGGSLWVQVTDKHQRRALVVTPGGLNCSRALRALRYASTLERRGDAFTFRSVGGLLTESEFGALRARLIDTGLLVDNGARRAASWTAAGLAMLEAAETASEYDVFSALSGSVCLQERNLGGSLAAGGGVVA